MDARSKTRLLRFLGWFRIVAAADLALGALLFTYALLAGPTGHLLRGALVLVAVGVVGLVQSRGWRRNLESAA